MAHTPTHKHTAAAVLKEIYAVFTDGKQNNKTNSRYPLSVNTTQPLTSFQRLREGVESTLGGCCECH